LVLSRSLRTNAVSIEVDESIEQRIESLDLSNVLISKLKCGYFFRPKHREHFNGGTQNHGGH
jgi:hypothetical protein